MSSLVPLATFLDRVTAHLTNGDGYCYGMYFSAVVDQEAIDAKAAQYPQQYNSYVLYMLELKQVKVWAQEWIGKLAGDCVGLVKSAYWTNDDDEVVYRYQGRADVSANGMYNLATNKGPITTMPDTAGLCVHKAGHMGVYMGNSKVIEARGVAYGVVETDLDLEDLDGAGNPRNWTQWFEAPYIDYGSTPEVPEVPNYTGINTVPEGLELGDMTPNSDIYEPDFSDMDYVIISGMYWNGADFVVSTGNIYADIWGIYDMQVTSDPFVMADYVDSMTTDGDAIKSVISIFMSPHLLTSGDSESMMAAHTSYYPYEFAMPNRPTTLDGYTPKNKKLLCYPYQYLYCHNNDGARILYKYENFSGAPAFKIIFGLVPNGTAKLVPTNVRNISSELEDIDQGITINCFPTCLFNINEYLSFVGTNGLSMNLQNAATLIGMGSEAIIGAATSNPIMLAGAVVGGISKVGNMIGKQTELEKMPPSANGGFSSQYALTGYGKNTFTLYTRSIKYQQAKRIDDFFEMYGYKTVEVKTPDYTTRPFWNYLKTVDVNITGTLPESDKLLLSKMFDSGITIWHDPDHFLDYSQNNHVVSGG